MPTCYLVRLRTSGPLLLKSSKIESFCRKVKKMEAMNTRLSIKRNLKKNKMASMVWLSKTKT